MRFCQAHWDALREKIDEKGLSSLVSESGEEIARRTVRELEEGEHTIDNYDPLMAAHWAIANNVMGIIADAGMNPLYLLSGGPEDPVEGYDKKYLGRTWPRCPLCYINLAHEVSCKDPRCQLPKENGYDWMLERAAQEQVEVWESLKP